MACDTSLMIQHTQGCESHASLPCIGWMIPVDNDITNILTIALIIIYYFFVGGGGGVQGQSAEDFAKMLRHIKRVCELD